MSTIKILIADDHLVVRQGLITMLQATDEFEIVGEATNGQEAVQLAEKLRPDIVLIDIQMPKLEGIEAIARIIGQNSNVGVVILSSYDQEEYVYRAIQAGAKGYVLKDSALDELLAVLRAVARGQTLLSSRIATKLTGYIATPKKSRNLTDRENEVLQYLAHGLRNKDIADQLYISERTVKNHVNSILSKLDAKTRTEAVSRALKEKLIDLDEI